MELRASWRKLTGEVAPNQAGTFLDVSGGGQSATTGLGIVRGTPQSFNRVNVRLLDAGGRPVSEEPVTSTVFTIVRSASFD